MDKKLPTGISRSGSGLRIRIWQDRRVIYAETIACDPCSQTAITAAAKRRDWICARLKLGLPLEAGAEGVQMFVDVAQDYLNLLDVKHSTSLSYETILNHYWMPHYQNFPVTAITTNDIKRRLSDLSISNKTKRNVLGPLRGVLQHAGVVPNPVDGIVFRRRQKPAIDRYSMREREALLSKLDGAPRVYFAVLFGCGLRPGEALGLQWSDWDGEELNISKQITRRRLENSTKTSKRRRVYVPKWVRPFLLNHDTRFEGGFIFRNTLGKPLKDTDDMNAAWKEAHRRARVPYRIPYTCRHTRAAELLSTGVEPAEAAKQMGHSLEMFFRVYAEWIEEYQGKTDKSRFEGAPVAKMSPKTGTEI